MAHPKVEEAWRRCDLELEATMKADWAQQKAERAARKAKRERLIAAIMKDDEITDEEYEEIGETPPAE